MLASEFPYRVTPSSVWVTESFPKPIANRLRHLDSNQEQGTNIVRDMRTVHPRVYRGTTYVRPFPPHYQGELSQLSYAASTSFYELDPVHDANSL
jgi:hypothetical protein